jgi:bifunctional non-homologous end joining protein LigD
MQKSAFDPCIPTGVKVPDRPEWIHEIKHDGYRLIVQRDGGVDGVSDFNRLHSRKHDAEVEFHAFDMLVGDGEDLRKLPLTMAQDQPGAAGRRHPLSTVRTGRDQPGAVQARLPDGIGGAGVEAQGSIVSSRSIAELGQGIKNRAHPAFSRVLEQF